jgi:hypothetical protein
MMLIISPPSSIRPPFVVAIDSTGGEEGEGPGEREEGESRRGVRGGSIPSGVEVLERKDAMAARLGLRFEGYEVRRMVCCG